MRFPRLLCAVSKFNFQRVHRPAAVLLWLAMVVAMAPPLPAKDVVRLPVPYMRQPDGSTCLPTSLCMAMHFMGRCDLTSATIFEFHKVCRTDRYNVPDLVRQYGLYAFPSWLESSWTRETIEHELNCGRPVVLGVDVSRAGHFVLAVGYTDDGKVIIHDPANPHPGWSFNGAYTTTTWDKLIWRNGIMLRGEPFPAPPRTISGTLVATTAPRTLVSGEMAMAEFAIKNNGTEPWPEGVALAPVDAYSIPTKERTSAFAILPGDEKATSGTWLSPTRAAAPSVNRLAPGETALFRVPLRAPATLVDGRPALYRENFNLIDASGHWFSEHWQTGPSNRQIFFRVSVVPPRRTDSVLPLEETVSGGKPSLPWKLKNGGAEVLAVAANAPAFPSVDLDTSGIVEVVAPPPSDEETTPTSTPDVGTTESAVAAVSATSTTLFSSLPRPKTPVLSLRPADGQDYEMAFVGDPLGTDYRVEAWVYCDVRPVERGRGYERAGIFMHDSGQHRITNKTELENGECLLMAYESNSGRIRAGNFLNGGVSDSGRGNVRIKESGWHRFAITAKGNEISYELDGNVIATARGFTGRGGGRGRRGGSASREASPRETDPRAVLRFGDCGVFCNYLSLGPDDPRHGLLFAGFRVDP
ncbi:MAG: C39 family peptidase [Candidatus Sumerlaeaceae bacterium]|nr:C39 family peptidase [Candidatus Sumerlaeaceae bacterium]